MAKKKCLKCGKVIKIMIFRNDETCSVACAKALQEQREAELSATQPLGEPESKPRKRRRATQNA